MLQRKTEQILLCVLLFLELKTFLYCLFFGEVNDICGLLEYLNLNSAFEFILSVKVCTLKLNYMILIKKIAEGKRACLKKGWSLKRFKKGCGLRRDILRREIDL